MPGDKSKIYIDIKSQYGMEILRVFRKLMSHGKKVGKHRGHLFIITVASEKVYYLEVYNLNLL